MRKADAEEYRQALAHAVEYNDAEIVKLLLSVELFSLSDAVNAGDPAAVRLAIERTPIQDANADEYHRCLIDAVRQDSFEIVEALLTAGMSPNALIHLQNDRRADLPLLTFAAHGWNHWPLLSFAAARGSTAAMRVLLKAGADPNAMPDSMAGLPPPFLAAGASITPLMIAATSSNIGAVTLLVEAGADLRAQDKKGRTALTYAKEAKFKRVVAYLQAVYEKRDAAGELSLCQAAATGTLYRVKALLDAGADVEHPDETGQTPLMCAIAAGHLEVVKMLCAAGASLAADLWTSAFAKPDTEMIRFLIEQGLDPNRKRESGPALLLAFGLHKPTEILKLLLDNGADVHALVPAERIEKARRRPRFKRDDPGVDNLKSPCTVLESRQVFLHSREVYYLLHTLRGCPQRDRGIFL